LGSIGYARVSTTDQNSDLQHVALKAAGCHRIFTDHGVSGSRASRPELNKMLKHLPGEGSLYRTPPIPSPGGGTPWLRRFLPSAAEEAGPDVVQ